MIEVNKIYEGDALTLLKTFPDEIVNCCVTSPPYYKLRDYGVKGQIGLEKTPEEYVQKLVEIFREVKRILKKDGTVWLNLGDSYAGGGFGAANYPTSNYKWKQNTSKGTLTKGLHGYKGGNGIKYKDLIGIPWMVAFALRADGWWLRQDIIWSKPNPMRESVTDRCTKSHEYIFLLSKSAKYYFDAKAIATPYKDKTYTTFGCEAKGSGDGTGLIKSENWGNDVKVRKPKQWKTPDGWDIGEGSHGTIHRNGREKGFKGYDHRGPGDKTLTGHSGNFDYAGNLIGDGLANKKSVWIVGTQSFSEAHFATFPEKLIVDCIKAGCPEGGLVLDPFGGANTTGVVSRKLNRNYVAIELNPKYIKIGENRVYDQIGLFL